MKRTTDTDAKTAKRIANYLGLAQKAGKIAAGDLATVNAVKKNKAVVVIVAKDAAPSVLKEIEEITASNHTPVYVWGEKIFLGSIIGKSQRGALAVLDKGFAEQIEKLFLA